MNYDIIFEELASNSSRKFKIDLLSQYKDDETLHRIIFLALDPYTNFFIKKIPDYSDVVGLDAYTLDEALMDLSKLSCREITGNAAIDFVTTMLASLDGNDAEVLKRIILKDLRCGVSEATVNAVWPGTIQVYGVCLAHKDISHIKYPAYCQIKYDGGFTHLHFDGVYVTAYTRSGNVVELHNALTDDAINLMRPGETWVGETIFYSKDGMMDRKTSNGLFNKGIRQTISVEEAAQVFFHVWDIVDHTSTIPYEDRYQLLQERFSDRLTDRIRLVHNFEVDNKEEALEHYNEFVSQGFEGVVLKNKDFKWEPKRVKGQGKVKAVETADLLITDIIEGTGKYKGMLGAVTGVTSCGKLTVNVGSGFSDDQRQAYYTQDIIGKVMTVKYNQKITDKKKLQHSLFLPIFVEIREDKNIANTMDELK